MRGEQHIVERAKAMRLDDGFFREAVEGGAGNSLFAQRLMQSVLVHDAAAGGVDKVSVRFHERQFTATDQAAGLVGERTV